MLYGAVGLGLAALFYFAALEIHGVLEYLPLVPEQGIVIFLLILGIELFEMGGTAFGMAWLAARVPLGVLDVVAPVYVALGGLYVLGYGVFSADERGLVVLAGLVVARWLVLLFLTLKAD